METITLAQLLEAVDGRLLGEFNALDTPISRVETDSRSIHPGALFIPLVGDRFDGHAYINSALSSGAAGCLTARQRDDVLPGKFYVEVDDTEKALGRLAAWYKNRFSIPFIGVTGSVGKTTAKDMLAAVLGVKYKVLKTEGNHNNNIGLPLTLLELDSSHQMGVLEMGMDKFGEIDYLAGIVEPDVGVITNIGDAHIERLGSRENIFKAKCEIFPHLKAEGLAILNGDDPMLAALRGTLPQPTVFVGEGEGLEYTARDLSTDGAGHLSCRVKTPRSQFQADIPALGSHMIYPTLMAAAVGEALGMAPDEMIQGIGAFLPTKMRMNIVRCKGDIVILNDAYNANPQSMRAAAAVLGDAQDRRKVAVVGDMKELGPGAEQFHRTVGGCFAQSGTNRLIAIGDLARFIAEGAQEAGLAQADYFPTLDGAKNALSREVRAGTTILVKASRSMAFEKIVDFLLANVPQ